MDLTQSMAFYKDRFADASDFTFVFVGSFDLPTMKPLVEKYLGGLPSQRRNEMVKDIGMRPPSGVVQKEVKSGIATLAVRSASCSADRSRTTSSTA